MVSCPVSRQRKFRTLTNLNGGEDNSVKIHTADTTIGAERDFNDDLVGRGAATEPDLKAWPGNPGRSRRLHKVRGRPVITETTLERGISVAQCDTTTPRIVPEDPITREPVAILWVRRSGGDLRAREGDGSPRWCGS
jgi:hypothetical protein